MIAASVTACVTPASGVRPPDLTFAAVRAIAPLVLGLEVEVPEPGEYVALGAARQAAAVLAA